MPATQSYLGGSMVSSEDFDLPWAPKDEACSAFYPAFSYSRGTTATTTVHYPSPRLSPRAAAYPRPHTICANLRRRPTRCPDAKAGMAAAHYALGFCPTPDRARASVNAASQSMQPRNANPHAVYASTPARSGRSRDGFASSSSLTGG
ncbi:hypothetical protein DFH06DRAFT_1352156 [Mycena polygramma]|nr:hypothetical protein C8R47DRAFT_1228834 [Mycena vitilis]KAJ6454017.1 hypothetical protein C8R47DRAFT_1228841 [Mycena vitilis]KAJ7601741.1 hypothetical protein DFH06DRAFT_1352156 [Mycena polygramma]